MRLTFRERFAVTLLVLWLWRRRDQRAPLVGWLWFLGMLVPTIGLVQVGMQSMADRYSYLPHVGLLIAIVWGAADLVGPRPAARRALAGVAIVIVAVLAITTAYQLRYWQNSYVLFHRALHLTGPNPMAANCVALWLTTHDRKDEALQYYLAALRIDPNMAGTHNNLGNLLRERGQLKSALAHLARAVSLEPNNAEAHHNLGNTLADLGRTDEAVAQFREALRLDPDLTPAYYNLGVTLAAAGRYDDAIDSFERALRLRPDDPDTRFVYALALAKVGRLDDAKRQFNLVLKTRSDWTEGMGHFAWLLATSAEEKSRDPQTAVALAEHANKLTLGDQPVLLDTLASAYASAGRFEEAVAVASRARDLASAREQRDFAARVDGRIQLYRSRRAFVASTQPVTAPATVPAAGR